MEPIEKSKDKIFYKPELDGLRFFAFFLVFIHHHPFFKEIPWLSFLKKVGWIGVDLFFVLSAYLFTKLLVLEFQKNQNISYKKFFLRRIFRIWPVYFIFIFSCLAFKGLSGEPLNTFTLFRFGGLITFTDNILSVLNGYNYAIPFVAHLWTISFEEQFYLIVPILILFLVKLPSTNKIIIFAVFFLLLNLLRFSLILKGAPYLALWVLPFTHFESIMFGIILGFFENFTSKVKSAVWLINTIILLIILSYFEISEVSMLSPILYFLTGVSMVTMVIYVLNSVYARAFLSQKLLVFLGKRSYGLYLYHFIGIFIGGFISNKLFDNNMGLSFFASLLVTIMISVISYHFIEKPFLRLKIKYEIIKSRPI